MVSYVKTQNTQPYSIEYILLSLEWILYDTKYVSWEDLEQQNEVDEEFTENF